MKLICGCCGQYAPAKKQWWNQDHGYGVCPKCYNEELARNVSLYGIQDGVAEAMKTYGKPGIHHSLEADALEASL